MWLAAIGLIISALAGAYQSSEARSQGKKAERQAKTQQAIQLASLDKSKPTEAAKPAQNVGQARDDMIRRALAGQGRGQGSFLNASPSTFRKTLLGQ